MDIVTLKEHEKILQRYHYLVNRLEECDKRLAGEKTWREIRIESLGNDEVAILKAYFEQELKHVMEVIEGL